MCNKFGLLFDDGGFPWAITKDGKPFIHLNASSYTCDNIEGFMQMLNGKNGEEDV